MALSVRILTAADHALLLKAPRGVFDHAIDPALAAEFLDDPRHHRAVAIDEGEIVGFASGAPAWVLCDEGNVAAQGLYAGAGGVRAAVGSMLFAFLR